MNKKYEILYDSDERCTEIIMDDDVDKTKLHRIKALRNIGELVKAGDIGGWVESENNLSQEDDDNSWIFDNSIVCNNSKIAKNSNILKSSIIKNNAIIKYSVVIESKIGGNSVINNSYNIVKSHIFGNAEITNSTLCNAWVWWGDFVIHNCKINRCSIKNKTNIYNSEIFELYTEDNCICTVRDSKINKCTIDLKAEIVDSEMNNLLINKNYHVSNKNKNVNITNSRFCDSSTVEIRGDNININNCIFNTCNGDITGNNANLSSANFTCSVFSLNGNNGEITNKEIAFPCYVDNDYKIECYNDLYSIKMVNIAEKLFFYHTKQNTCKVIIMSKLISYTSSKWSDDAIQYCFDFQEFIDVIVNPCKDEKLKEEYILICKLAIMNFSKDRVDESGIILYPNINFKYNL